jgi:A/G-specific adenine glycosylase
MAAVTAAALHEPVLAWYAANARSLPWRSPSTGPWGVLVSEVMLQQTPVRRVEPVYRAWLRRWPGPADLAAEPPGEAIRAWGRLGYPRRALRLHAAATEIVSRHDGRVPSSYDDLLGLPGVGSYTAAAVASFAFGGRHAVLDTNVRRVLVRSLAGAESPAPALTAAERALGESAVPARASTAARWAVAVMELGALVCTSRAPRCEQCPVASGCAWHRAGRPADPARRSRTQAYEGTDRQARGRLLAAARAAHGPVDGPVLLAACPDRTQAARALRSLLDDGLLVLAEGGYRLP